MARPSRSPRRATAARSSTSKPSRASASRWKPFPAWSRASAHPRPSRLAVVALVGARRVVATTALPTAVARRHRVVRVSRAVVKHRVLKVAATRPVSRATASNAKPRVATAASTTVATAVRPVVVLATGPPPVPASVPSPQASPASVATTALPNVAPIASATAATRSVPLCVGASSSRAVPKVVRPPARWPVAARAEHRPSVEHHPAKRAPHAGPFFCRFAGVASQPREIRGTDRADRGRAGCACRPR